MTDAPSNHHKIKGVLSQALLRAELKAGQDGQVSEEEMQAAWSARRDELLESAGAVRQILRRMGYDIVEKAPVETQAKN